MANKDANVNARVEQNIKAEAEGILAEMGIPASVGINMFYRQIIYCHGLPFRPVAYSRRPRSLDELTTEEFDARMAAGLKEAKAGDGSSLDDAFNGLIGELTRG